MLYRYVESKISEKAVTLKLLKCAIPDCGAPITPHVRPSALLVLPLYLCQCNSCTNLLARSLVLPTVTDYRVELLCSCVCLLVSLGSCYVLACVCMC